MYRKVLNENTNKYFLLENYRCKDDINKRKFTDQIIVQGTKKEVTAYAKRLFATVSNCLTFIECDSNGENRKGYGVVYVRDI